MKARVLFLTVGISMMPLAYGAGSSGRAQQNYIHQCAGCHQLNGSGSVENGIPDMRGMIGNYLRTPDGRAFLVQVPGVANSPLSNKEIAQVLGWMLKTFSPTEIPEGAEPFTEEEVARLREARPADVPTLRAAMVARLKELGHPVN